MTTVGAGDECPGHAESLWLARHGTSVQRLLFLLLCGLVAFNACDVLLTLRGISLGRLKEGNALMNSLLHINTPLAITIKMVAVGVGSLLLWYLRDRRFVFWSTVMLTGGYGVLVFYETLLLVGP